VLASDGKYRIVSVGKGIAAEDDKEESSSNILSQLPTALIS
jgi:prefoldin subunit 5